jgi:antitoxin (DNA-binding transcriptional repressor) of toxin-antitoxin stability system
MKFITVRDLRGRSGQVWTKLAREREVILTSNGKPIAILSAVSEETLEESLVAVRRARAVAAVEKLQRQSIQAGTNALSPAEIASEIKAVRKARRR